jgi:energy-converting hydrogenase Eha subunit E
MNFGDLPRTKSLWYRIALALIALGFLSALAGCASTEPMSRQVDLDVKEKGNSLVNFRFLISTNVTLISTDRTVIPEPNVDPTRLRDNNITDRVLLKVNTTGRLQWGDIDSGLHVSFEERNGSKPTIEFVQNKGKGLLDKFYFNWQINPATGERYIMYENRRYIVTYEGDEEPFLQIKRIGRDKKTSRKMPGIR